MQSSATFERHYTEEYYIFDATGRVLAVHNLQTEDTDWYVHGRERIARFQTRESDAGIPAEAAGENDGSSNFPESFHFPNDYTPHIFPLYYIYDHLGNTRVTYRNLFQCGNQDVDGEGGEPTHYLLKHLHDYFPYGKTLREWYASNEDTERFQTTHHQRDVETTLDYRGARFYDADVGRFLSLDPLAADFPSWSDYNYVYGNPLSYIDPNGKEGVAVVDRENKTVHIYMKFHISEEDLRIMKEHGGTNSAKSIEDLESEFLSIFEDYIAEIDGEVYCTTFGLEFQVHEKKADKEKAFSEDMSLGSNLFNAEKGYGASRFNDSRLKYKVGSADKSTFAHESGHGLGLNHPVSHKIKSTNEDKWEFVMRGRSPTVNAYGKKRYVRIKGEEKGPLMSYRMSRSLSTEEKRSIVAPAVRYFTNAKRKKQKKLGNTYRVRVKEN